MTPGFNPQYDMHKKAVSFVCVVNVSGIRYPTYDGFGVTYGILENELYFNYDMQSLNILHYYYTLKFHMNNCASKAYGVKDLRRIILC
jgi:hypothetical protein